ncbi:hypothetical protein HDU96_001292, partial [Phlyctochytrium bullatum]
MQNLGNRQMPILTYSTLRANKTANAQTWMLKFLRHVDAHGLAIKSADYGGAIKTVPLSQHLETEIKDKTGADAAHQNNLYAAERTPIHHLVAQHVDDQTFGAYEQAIQSADSRPPYAGWQQLLKLAKLDAQQVLPTIRNQLATLQQGDSSLTDYLAAARAIGNAITKNKLDKQGLTHTTLAQAFKSGLNVKLQDALYTTYTLTKPALKTDWTECEAFFRDYAQHHDNATRASEDALQTALLSAHRPPPAFPQPNPQVTRPIDPRPGFQHQQNPNPPPNPQGLPCP